MKAWIVAVALSAPGVALAEPLELSCRGVARFSETTQAQSTSWNGWDAPRNTTTTMTGTDSANAILRIRINAEGAGEIRVPSELTPLLRSGSKDGWRPFNELTLSDNEIRGRFTLNPLNKPRVLVDRRTGDIELTGWGGGFTGNCERVPDGAEARKF